MAQLVKKLKFRNWETHYDGVVYANDQGYEAKTDGIAVAFGTPGAGNIRALTAATTPLVDGDKKQISYIATVSQNMSAVIPVKKGHYFKFQGANYIYWMPLK